MSFRDAVKNTPTVANAWQSGLQALHAGDRARVQVRNPRLITGSLGLDKALEMLQPNDPRWDYGIGYGPSENERAVWVEIHPASSDSVTKMLQKLEWLKAWLQNCAPQLHILTKGDYHWVATDGTVGITPNSPQAKRLAAAGMRGPVRQLSIE